MEIPPEEVTITFEQGYPVSINGKTFANVVEPSRRQRTELAGGTVMGVTIRPALRTSDY